jgi:hypothetical protein
MTDTKQTTDRDTVMRQVCARHDDDTLTVDEVALLLRKTRSWVVEHAARRRRPYLPAEKMGKSFSFRWGTLKAWRKSLEHNG